MIQDPEARRLLAASSTALRNIADALQVIVNNMEDRTATEATDNTHNSKLVPFPHPNAAPAPTFMMQDVFENEPFYAANREGRM